MHKLIIRDMREEDLPAVMEIEKISFSSPWTEEFFLSELRKKYSLSKVAVFEEKVIGYVCADYKFHEARILDLAVSPGFRRQSAATLLMHEIMKELRERGCVFAYLKVRVSNSPAQEFYEFLGFKTESVRKKYYDEPGEDAMVMIARL